MRKATSGRGSIVTITVSSMSLIRPSVVSGPTTRTWVTTGGLSATSRPMSCQPGGRSESRRTSTYPWLPETTSWTRSPSDDAHRHALGGQHREAGEAAHDLVVAGGHALGGEQHAGEDADPAVAAVPGVGDHARHPAVARQPAAHDGLHRLVDRADVAGSDPEPLGDTHARILSHLRAHVSRSSTG